MTAVSNVADMLVRAVGTRPDRVAITEPGSGRAVTWAELLG